MLMLSYEHVAIPTSWIYVALREWGVFVIAGAYNIAAEVQLTDRPWQ